MLIWSQVGSQVEIWTTSSLKIKSLKYMWSVKRLYVLTGVNINTTCYRTKHRFWATSGSKCMENIQGQGNGGNNGNKKGIFTNLKSSVTSAYLYLLPAAVWCSLVLINIAKINGASLKDADKAMASTVVIGVAFLIISKMEKYQVKQMAMNTIMVAVGMIAYYLLK